MNKTRFEKLPDGTMFRFGRIEDMDISFDLEFWQSQSPTSIFNAAWEMVVFAHKVKGGKENELRFQRSVCNLQKFPS